LYTAFGIPTWALVDGTWAVLSQLADTLPEGYNISAYLILALTFGNLVPLVVGAKLKNASRTVLSRLIRAILWTGLITGTLLAICWKQTVSISSQKVSLPLLVLFFIVGACSSSSNVTHYTHVSSSDASNTTALATGMGLGSMTAGVLALLQGIVLIDYGFSVTYYYLVLSLLFIPAILAFSTLSRTEDHIESDTAETENPLSSTGDLGSLGDSAAVDMAVNSPSVEKSVESEPYAYDERHFLTQNWAILCLQVVNASLGYGIVPAFISYACSKFNDRSTVLLLSTGIGKYRKYVLNPPFLCPTY
jgi:hypothetical protein